MIDLRYLLNRNKIPYFLCIGTSKSDFDNVAVTIGDKLIKAGYAVLGTTDKQLHGKSIVGYNDEIISKLDNNIYQTIAIDISTGINDVPYTITDKSIQPGSGIGKNLPFLGDISIHINVEYFVPRFATLYHMILQPLHPSYVVYTDKMTDIVYGMITSELGYAEDKQSAIQSRTMRAADLILNKNMTIRDVAKRFGLSKSTVHRDINVNLPKYNELLYKTIKALFAYRFENKYMIGGIATKRSWGVKRNAKAAESVN